MTAALAQKQVRVKAHTGRPVLVRRESLQGSAGLVRICPTARACPIGGSAYGAVQSLAPGIYCAA
jgi:hypothetical protein